MSNKPVRGPLIGLVVTTTPSGVEVALDLLEYDPNQAKPHRTVLLRTSAPSVGEATDRALTAIDSLASDARGAVLSVLRPHAAVSPDGWASRLPVVEERCGHLRAGVECGLTPGHVIHDNGPHPVYGSQAHKFVPASLGAARADRVSLRDSCEPTPLATAVAFAEETKPDELREAVGRAIKRACSTNLATEDSMTVARLHGLVVEFLGAADEIERVGVRYASGDARARYNKATRALRVVAGIDK